MVQALENIPMLTFLCEYSGNVWSWRQTIGSKNDSIMILLDTDDSETSLNVVSETHSNIGWFFSGINNFTEEGWMK